MGGLTGAVDWWEEWQLRILVLGSLAVQSILFVFSFWRRKAIPALLRFTMWLAYLAGDAVAIYALATLFNRHKPAGEDGSGGSRMLEVVWAPILLLHLGGHDGITAYNIEDNELWSRHLVTAVSQVTVAIYVFCKSWPAAAAGGDDKRLLAAAILLFIPGILKCFAKPWALKSASIYSLVSSPPAVRQNEGEEMAHRLEDYVNKAKGLFVGEEKDDDGEGLMRAEYVEDEEGRPSSNPNYSVVKEKVKEMLEGRSGACKLFVDLSSPFPCRLSILQQFRVLIKEERAYDSVRQGLATAFLLLYTKLKTAGWMDLGLEEEGMEGGWMDIGLKVEGMQGGWMDFGRRCIQILRVVLPWASVGLFHQSHRESQNAIDVKITYAMICCTAVLESYSGFAVMLTPTGEAGEEWPEMVAQHSLIGYFARNVNSKRMWVVSSLGCKAFLDQHWRMKPCFSSAVISELVLGYLKHGWEEKIHDATSYLRFNDHRAVNQGLGLSTTNTADHRLRLLSFDETVLIWHIATDFCFFSDRRRDRDHRCAFAEVPPVWSICIPCPWTQQQETIWRKIRRRNRRSNKEKNHGKNKNNQTRRTTSRCREELPECTAVLCTQMSNYMAYLLLVNPEMLLPGSRRNLFITAHQELQAIFKGDEQPPPLEKSELTRRIANKLKSSSSSSEAAAGSPFIREAWMLAQKLMNNNLNLGGGDEKKMWDVIQGVWVEMLCFSASRCRGYLHAKALGSGGEFLSYVWLLLFHMGMETFTDKLQREDLRLPLHEQEASSGSDNAPPSSTSERRVPFPSGSATATATAVAAGAPSTSSSELHTAAPSTSEIRMAQEDDGMDIV